jgi:hypothetical protein
MFATAARTFAIAQRTSAIDARMCAIVVRIDATRFTMADVATGAKMFAIVVRMFAIVWKTGAIVARTCVTGVRMFATVVRTGATGARPNAHHPDRSEGSLRSTSRGRGSLVAASRSRRHASSTCLRSVLRLPIASRSTYRPSSFVCDRYALPLAFTRSRIAALSTSRSASYAPAGTSENGTGAARSHSGSSSIHDASSRAISICWRSRAANPSAPNARMTIHSLSARNRRPSCTP